MNTTSDVSGKSWIKVWDLPLRLFHWLLVLAVAMAFLSSEEDSALNEWHVLSGWIAALLIVFRLVWGLVGGEHSRFADFVRPGRIGHHVSALLGGKGDASLGHNPLGALAVILLLALAAATVATGAFGGEAIAEIHETIAWVLLAMVGLHVTAVVVMSVLQRESLVGAMVTGRKRASRHPGAVDARGPGVAAIVVAIVAVVAAAILILRYDPAAFTLRSSESIEHRASPAQAAGIERQEKDEN